MISGVGGEGALHFRNVVRFLFLPRDLNEAGPGHCMGWRPPEAGAVGGARLLHPAKKRQGRGQVVVISGRIGRRRSLLVERGCAGMQTGPREDHPKGVQGIGVGRQ